MRRKASRGEPKVLEKGNLGKEKSSAAAASEEIATLVKNASVTVEPDWPCFFAKLCKKRNIEDHIVDIDFGGGAAFSVAVFLLRPWHLLVRIQI